MRALTRPYFIIRGDGLKEAITIDLEVDLYYWYREGATSLVFFTKPLPVASAFAVLERAQKMISLNLKKRTRALMASMGLLDDYLYQRIALKRREEREFDQDLLKILYETLQGRLLYFQEIEASLRERGLGSLPISAHLQLLLLQEKIHLLPSLSKRGKGFYCHRCGGARVEESICPFCHRREYLCSSCQVMGESRLCRPLFGSSGHDLVFPPHSTSYHLDFTLSPFQSVTAKRLKGLIQREDKKRVLFWAVCGAGKTEVTFPLIDSFLAEGRPILLALPRRDVVHQLGDRIREAFSPLPVVVLSGSSRTRYSKGNLVVATTHQVIRFQDLFHLIILDEFDAFPYSTEPMLEYGIQRSLVPGGHLVYMSATPERASLSAVREKEWGLVRLPLRFHHKPLPEPELFCGDLTGMFKGSTLLPRIFRFFYRSLILQKAQVFVFVPTKDLTLKVKEWLSSFFQDLAGITVDALHSKVANREEKTASFFRGKTRVMVTTTILERGVTIPRCDVLVFYACYESIFDEKTLVQISGRTGRSKEYPKGEVLFCGERISSSMEEAKREVMSLNTWARERGLFQE